MGERYGSVHDDPLYTTHQETDMLRCGNVNERLYIHLSTARLEVFAFVKCKYHPPSACSEREQRTEHLIH